MAPLFDAATLSSYVSSQASPANFSWTHPVSNDPNNAGIVAAFVTNNGSNNFVPSSAVVSIGGIALPSLGSVLMNNLSNAGFIWVWGAMKVPAGPSQPVVMDLTDTGQTLIGAYGLSLTYKDVGQIGALQTGFGVNVQPSLSVPTQPQHTVVGFIGNYESQTYSGFSLPNTHETQASNIPFFIVGDGPGSGSSVTVSATQANDTVAWAICGLDLWPAPINRLITTQSVQRAALW